MDTRRTPGPGDGSRTLVEIGTDTGHVELVELAHARYIVEARGPRDLGALLSMFALIGVVTVIAIFAIATSAGWSILLGS